MLRSITVGNGIGAVLGAWSPLTPGNLLAWYKADVGVTESSGAVSDWADQSGNGHTLTQGTAGAKPTFQATGWNGSKPTISFDGSSDFLANTSGLSTYLNGTNKNISVVATMRMTDNAASFLFPFVWRNDPANDGPVSMNFALSSRQYLQEFRNNAENDPGALNVSERFSRFAWVAGGGSGSTYVDALLDLNAASFSTSASGHNSFLMGTSHLGTFWLQGLISEVAIYSSQLTLTDLQNYLTYSLAKWGGLGSPLVVGVSANSADTNGTGATNTVPGSPATNDIIVAHIAITGNASTVSPPAGEGWAQIATTTDTAGSDCQCEVWWKRWGSGSTDNTSVAFTGTAGNMRLVLSRLKGCKTTGNPFTASATNNGGGAGTGTTITAPTATGASQQRVMRFYAGSGTTVTATPDAPQVSLYAHGFTSGVDGTIACGEQPLDSNPTGTATATSSGTLVNGWAAITVTFTSV